MARRQNPITVVERRRSRVASLYCKGYSLAKIAEALEVGITTAHRDLDHIRKAWRERAIDSYQVKVDRELAKIDLLEFEAYEAWELSKTPGEVNNTEIANDGKQNSPDRRTVSRRVEQRLPDASYLDTIRWCIEQRCKLLSLYKGPQLTGGGEQGFAETTQNFMLLLPTLTPEQLHALASVQRLIGPVPENAKGIVDGHTSDRREDSVGAEPAGGGEGAV